MRYNDIQEGWGTHVEAQMHDGRRWGPARLHGLTAVASHPFTLYLARFCALAGVTGLITLIIHLAGSWIDLTLGLALCRGIAEAHGGRIWLGTGGVTVRVALPLYGGDGLTLMDRG